MKSKRNIILVSVVICIVLIVLLVFGRMKNQTPERSEPQNSVVKEQEGQMEEQNGEQESSGSESVISGNEENKTENNTESEDQGSDESENETKGSEQPQILENQGNLEIILPEDMEDGGF